MDTNRTIYYKPKPAKTASLLIIDKLCKPTVVTLTGDKTLGRDYPQADCDIRLLSQIVSRRHGEFIFDDSDGAYYYIDNNSYNGTYINGERPAPYNDRGSRAYRLSDGDIIRIDHAELHSPHPDAVLIVFSTSFDMNEKWSTLDISRMDALSIGRGENCTLRLGDLMASRCHAMMLHEGGCWYIEDNGSTNGVGVNGEEISRQTRLFDNDVIRIANTTLVMTHGRLFYNNGGGKERSALMVDIRAKKVDFGRKTLLKDIRAEFENGDFVLILGGSGAGKTTLIRAILGESKAEGRIILNGQDLYKNFKNMKSQIGMVPQFLTLRKNDTVRNTLMDTAGIKLGSCTKQEREQRVDNILEHVGIKEHQNKLIGQLSGGQQKKAAVANQLVGFQKVFICDEPDSGLDAASRTQQMEILKEISQENKIVMVITHEPDDAVQVIDGVKKSLFTKVIVLARNSVDRAGHLAFYGSVENALAFFGVSRLQDIMIEINPPAEGGKGRADEYIRKYKMLTGGRNIG